MRLFDRFRLVFFKDDTVILWQGIGSRLEAVSPVPPSFLYRKRINEAGRWNEAVTSVSFLILIEIMVIISSRSQLYPDARISSKLSRVNCASLSAQTRVDPETLIFAGY